MRIALQAPTLLHKPQQVCPQCWNGLSRISRVLGIKYAQGSWNSHRAASSSTTRISATHLPPRRADTPRSTELNTYKHANDLKRQYATSTNLYSRRPFLSPKTSRSDLTSRRRNSTQAEPTKVSKTSTISSNTSQSTETEDPKALPNDASSQLSSHARLQPPMSLKRMFTTYLSLSKPRLTFLMVLSTASAYSLYPVPSVLQSSVTESPSLSALTLVYLTAGTGLCSAAANTFNMIMEPEHDAKMSRTRNRPLVRGLISKRGALCFALVAGTIGVVGLYVGVNPTVSFLGALNIFLYAGIYTPMKRISVVNTWVGAVVGAIPPLMGWAAGAGQCAVGVGDWKELLFGPNAAGGWLLAILLFSWQFHHFNALSWTVRYEYKHAGYRMLAWVNEAMNARVALRYALLCFPACWGLSYVGVTDWGYVATSSLVNAWIAQAAWRFYQHKGAKGTARGLFWAGVWQLPVLLVLAMAEKKGLWAGVRSRYFDDEVQALDEEPDTLTEATSTVQ